FNGQHMAAGFYDTMAGNGRSEAKCEAKAAAQAIPTWIFIILGVVMIVAAFILKNTAGRPASVLVSAPAPTPEKSAAQKFEELQHLLDRKLITQEEFDKKRQKILDNM
ncbi:SHOCT domain-containing protein, partial [Glutamicibacter arilaitensis]